jgi:tetratricopeptide (TPR) repeat protein
MKNGIPMTVSMLRSVRAVLRPSFFVMVVALSSCLAPSRQPERPPLEEEPPWESMSASLALGDPGKALADYESALSGERLTSGSRFLHARLLIAAGRLADARAELVLLVAEQPGDVEVLYTLALLEGLEGNAQRRRELLEKVVSLAPDHAGAHAGLGELALERDDAAAAGRFFEAALGADPTNLVALLGMSELRAREKDWAGSAEAAARAIEAEPAYSFAYIDRARARKAVGETAGAIEDYSRAIELDPAYPWTYIDRGRLYLQEARTDEALADFGLATARGPEIFAGWAYRAQMLYDAGKDEEALSDFERVVSLRPNYWFAFSPLGVLAFSKGDWAKARLHFLEAYRYEEEHSYLLLAALAARREGDARGAAALIEGALPGIPRDAWQYEVARFLLKPEADFTLAARADGEKSRTTRARMLFYLADQALASGRERTAASWLAEINDSGAPTAIETRLARRALARFAAQKQE